MNKKLAIWITSKVGTMWCAYLFACIGVGSLIGIMTGNAILGLACGAVSSYFLQLVLLPIIMVGQNASAEASEARMEKMMEHISREVDRILLDLEEK